MFRIKWFIKFGKKKSNYLLLFLLLKYFRITDKFDWFLIIIINHHLNNSYLIYIQNLMKSSIQLKNFTMISFMMDLFQREFALKLVSDFIIYYIDPTMIYTDGICTSVVCYTLRRNVNYWRKNWLKMKYSFLNMTM